MKICVKCRTDKPLAEYTKDRASKDGYYHTCKACKNAVAKRRYDNNESYRSSVKSRSRDRFQVGRQIIEEAKRNGCSLCPERESVCLSFHHTDPNEKDFMMGTGKTRSPEKIREEIAKCVVVCHNCHSKIHAGLIDLSL